MLKHLNRTSALILVVITFLLVFASGRAQAEMYKWRNANGVLEYSDVLPPVKASNIAGKDTVSSLQAASQRADFCPDVLPAKDASNNNLIANFAEKKVSNTPTRKSNSQFMESKIACKSTCCCYECQSNFSTQNDCRL